MQQRPVEASGWWSRTRRAQRMETESATLAAEAASRNAMAACRAVRLGTLHLAPPLFV